MTTSPLTVAECGDVRRYCGYPVVGGLLGQSADVQASSAALDVILAALTDVATSTVRTVFLANLSAMESALAGSYDGLDIKKAAVYERNLNELQDRDALFTNWRFRLCFFLGISPGPGVVTGIGAGSATYVPAVYAV